MKSTTKGNTMKLQTLDGTIHEARKTTIKSRRNGVTILDRVIVTTCGTAATGNTTSERVSCPNCK